MAEKYPASWGLTQRVRQALIILSRMPFLYWSTQTYEAFRELLFEPLLLEVWFFRLPLDFSVAEISTELAFKNAITSADLDAEILFIDRIRMRAQVEGKLKSS